MAKARVPAGATRAPSEGAPQIPSPVYRVRDAPLTLSGSEKGQQTRAARIGTAKRNAFEATAEGQARMSRPLEPQGSMSRADLYKAMGHTDNARHPMGQETLPGMDNLASGRAAGLVTSGHGTLPDTVPVAREKHLAPGEHADVLRHAARFGATRESLKAAISAHVDQAFANTPLHAPHPHAQGFYDDPAPHMPVGHMLQAGKDTGRSVSMIGTAAAVTSPQTEWGPTDEGHYPNIRAARAVAMHPTSEPDKIAVPTVSDEPGESRKVGTFRTNMVKGVRALGQQDKGVLAGDLAYESGRKMFNTDSTQKTTAFRNALIDPEGPHSSLVSDVQTGGRGFVPHLSPEEAGLYLKHPGVHQLHDSIFREVMAERGLQSVNKSQASQWGEAQIQSSGSRVTSEKAFGQSPRPDVDPRQTTMFAAPHHPALGPQFGGK